MDVDLETKMVRVGVNAEARWRTDADARAVDAVKGAGFDAEPEF